MEIAIPEPAGAAGVVRREEWRRRGSGGLQHTQIEATHWSAPAHSYGKVVEGVSCVGSDGRSLRARRQVEVLSARGPGLLQVLTASHTTSHSHSSSSTGFQRHFDDLQLKVNPLDVSSQKDRLSIGRSGMLSGRRPPSKVRPLLGEGSSTVSRLCHWFDADTQPQALQSPSIVANGSQHINNTQTIELSKNNIAIVEALSGSDKHSSSSETTDFNDSTNGYKTNSSKNSEDSFYDSCPEKESVFRDESDQLEEWRRASKVRRSLQYPTKMSRIGNAKPLDLPENWGSVSRIKKELENCQKQTWFGKTIKTASFSVIGDESSIASDKTLARPENISEEPENISDGMSSSTEGFLIKPSILKKKAFVNTDTLNEIRGKLKSTSDHAVQELDDGIVAEDHSEKLEETTASDDKIALPNVRSYIYGMESMMNSSQSKSAYSCGTNSLESRVSKLINGISARSDDWHARRKSYGFEKVQNNQKPSNHLLSNLEKNMESSTDSGICRSSEVMNLLSNHSMSTNKSDHFESQKTSRGTVITLGSADKKESFETWLLNNRKPVSMTAQNPKKATSDDLKSKSLIAQSANQISISIPVKQEPTIVTKDPSLKDFQEDLSPSFDLYDPSIMSNSVPTLSKKSDEFPFKRHTIAVDGFKSNSHLNDFANDIFEKKNKKVEFCKTEVHFTADSGRVNIVETDGKPPSTNNFRRRRKSGTVPSAKEVDKTLPVTHFGDSFMDKPIVDAQSASNAENKDGLKLNYAIITEIKGTPKEAESNSELLDAQNSLNNNEEVSESEQPRGILKNKPLKPKPYHLGEDKNVLSEINSTQFNIEKNVWGIKLRPTQTRTEAPLWCSSVTLKNDTFKDPLIQDIDESHEGSKSYGKIQKIPNDKPSANTACSYNSKNQVEIKGYSTKVNFGIGEPIVETSYNHKDKSPPLPSINKVSESDISHNQFDISESKTRGNKQSIVISKYLKMSPNHSYKDNQANDELQIINKMKSAMNFSQEDIDKTGAKKEVSSSGKDYQHASSLSFADTLSTPRSLMPTRGSARKLKEHELSYFGIKACNKNENDHNQNSLRRQNQANKNTMENLAIIKDNNEKHFYGNVQTKQLEVKNTSMKKSESYREENPIYENLSVHKKVTNDVTTKSINSGESIIDELTKAADEILQALNDYSDEDTMKLTYSSDSTQKNYKNTQSLATISEAVMWKDKSKASEHKAVQTIIGGTKRYNTATSTKTSKIRTSSNSSLESIPKEQRIPMVSRKKPSVNEQSLERPERPQRKKSSSGEVVKARRLQRANSRDALLQIHGSSSEDISGHLDVARKKTVRRSKHSADPAKREDLRVSSDNQSNTRSVDRKRESSKSSSKRASTAVPEIRHKTAVSTIMSLSDRHASMDKSGEKTKPTSHERSRHRERIREGTISSLTRDKITLKEKSRSADTSLERDGRDGHVKEKSRSRDSTHRREKSRDKSRNVDSEKLKKISEEMESEKEGKSKSLFNKKSASSAANAPIRSLQRRSPSGRTYERHTAGGKVTNVRTEYDKTLRLI